MRSALVALVLVAAAASPASADGVYVYEAFGGSDVKDELGAAMDSAFRIKAGLGYRRRNIAVEAWIGGALSLGIAHHHDDGAPPPYECDGKHCEPVSQADADVDGLFTYGLDVKYLAPLSPNVELYVRGGVSRGVLDQHYAGNGLGLGAGIQIKGKVPAVGFLFWPLFFTDWGPKVTASLFLDNSFEFYRLHAADSRARNRAIDAQLNTLIIGFGVGSDF